MKLGLIAISGVRAQNKELMDFGLTLPGFVERSKTIASLPSLGLLTLAGMTPKSVDVAYIEVRDLDSAGDSLEDFDVVAISSLSAQVEDAYALADRYRAMNVHVILGGLHVTARPEEALRHADTIVIGEGEPVWPRVIEDLQKNRPQRVYDARATPFDLSQAPIPKFDLLDPKRYNRLTVQTQRGCPHNCEFCAASIRLSARYRVKPVGKVIDEIRRIKEIWPKPFMEFADDNTFVDRAHSKLLLRSLVPEGVRWFTETDISVAQDTELLDLMRESGCAQVLIGFEGVTQQSLSGIELRADWKAKQYESYMRAIERIQSRGISVNGCFVLGLDGTDAESFPQILEFVRESGLAEVQITVLTPFPGTPLYARLEREGRLLRPGQWEYCTLFDVNFEPKQMTASELESRFRWLGSELYSDSATRERRSRFTQQLRSAKLRNKREDVA